LRYVSKFIIYELIAVIKVPVCPFVNPRNAKRLKGVTVNMTVPEADVNVIRFRDGTVAKTPTALPTVELSDAIKDANV